MSTSLARLSAVREVENVLLFISDSLRDDYLPRRIAELGVRTHAVSPSTYTASSLPSMLTSTFPHEHGTWNFSFQLPNPPHLLTQATSSGVNVDDVWGEEYENETKPTLSVLNLAENTRLDDLEEPFTFVVHDHGGHSPYGRHGDGFTTTREFFRENDFSQARLVDLYERGVEQSADRFLALYDRLDDRGLLEDTLVVFTSDHGELLGEHGGLYEHTSPMVPETVEVPIVWCGAGLPATHVEDRLFSGVDVAPTALGATGRSIPAEMRGLDLWRGTPGNRPVRADVWRETRFGDRVRYAASSVWNQDGGVVVHRGSRLGRIAYALGSHVYRAPYAPLVRRRPIRSVRALLGVHAPRRVEYGTYTGGTAPEDLLDDRFEIDESTGDVDVDREQLEALGYVQ